MNEQTKPTPEEFIKAALAGLNQNVTNNYRKHNQVFDGDMHFVIANLRAALVALAKAEEGA
jgi:hypothetical protein